ncbi:MAG: hypothetical protein V7L12_00780 [Nostoc sp.]
MIHQHCQQVKANSQLLLNLLSDHGNNAQDDGFYFSLRYQP